MNRMDESTEVRMCFRAVTVTPPHHTTPMVEPFFFFFLETERRSFSFRFLSQYCLSTGQKKKAAGFPDTFFTLPWNSRPANRFPRLPSRRTTHATLVQISSKIRQTAVFVLASERDRLHPHQKTLPTQQPPPEHGQ